MTKRFDFLNETKDRITYDFKRSLMVNVIIFVSLLIVALVVPGWGIAAGIGLIAAGFYTVFDVTRYIVRRARLKKAHSFV